MKWIKASKQLPCKKDRYFVRLDSRSKELIYFNGNRFETYEWITHDHIEWLYEDDKPLLEKIKELEEENDEILRQRNEWGSKNILMGKKIHDFERDSKVIIELENTIYHERANNEQTLLVLSKRDAEIEALKERINNLEGLAKKMFL